MGGCRLIGHKDGILGQQGRGMGEGGTWKARLFLEPRSLPSKWAQCLGFLTGDIYVF